MILDEVTASPIERNPRDTEALKRTLLNPTFVPEDGKTTLGRGHEWIFSLKPQHLFHTWLLGQISVTTLRIDRSHRVTLDLPLSLRQSVG